MEQSSPAAVAREVATLHFTLATAGHVDHGKTSLLRALTGIDPDRLKEEKERQMTTDIGFAHLRIPVGELKDGKIDRFKELWARTEKSSLSDQGNGGSALSARQGKDDEGSSESQVGDKSRSQSQFSIGEGSELVVGFVDVPGHGKFLKNMLAGVGAIDMALVVVAADEGPMPQTIQHVKIISLLGVRKCILVLNKVDLADEETQAVALSEAQELLAAYGVEVLESVKTAVGSAIDADTGGSSSIGGSGAGSSSGGGSRSGDGIASSGVAELRSAIVRQVLTLPYKERILDAGGTELPSFLPVDRVFSKSGFGVVVTGTLVKGVIKVGDNVLIQPGDIGARVRGLETFGRRLERALPGQRLAVNMSLKENKAIERGFAIVGSENTKPTDTLIVQITDLGGIEVSGKEVRKGGIASGKASAKAVSSSRGASGEHVSARDKISPQAIRFYHGTAERVGQLRWIDIVERAPDKERDKASGEASDGNSGESGRVHSGESYGVHSGESLEDRSGAPVVIGQLHLTEPVVAKPGERFVVRYGDYGIAGGEILVASRPRWLTRPLLNQLSTSILQGSLDEAAVAFINSAPHKSISASNLVDLIPEAELAPLLARLVNDHKVVKLGDQLITEEEKKQIEDGIKKAVNEPQSETDEPGFSQESVRVKIAPLLDRTVFQHIVKDMVAGELLQKSGERIALPGKVAGATSEKQEAFGRVLKVLSEHICLEISELGKSTGYGDKELVSILNQLSKEGKAVVVNYEYASTTAAIKQAHEALSRVWQQKRNISPGDFREELGVSRKYIMALLAHFDDTQVTRRLQSGRVLLKNP